jgi:hypothetical protein
MPPNLFAHRKIVKLLSNQDKEFYICPMFKSKGFDLTGYSYWRIFISVRIVM